MDSSAAWQPGDALSACLCANAYHLLDYCWAPRLNLQGLELQPPPAMQEVCRVGYSISQSMPLTSKQQSRQTLVASEQQTNPTIQGTLILGMHVMWS